MLRLERRVEQQVDRDREVALMHALPAWLDAGPRDASAPRRPTQHRVQVKRRDRAGSAPAQRTLNEGGHGVLSRRSPGRWRHIAAAAPRVAADHEGRTQQRRTAERASAANPLRQVCARRMRW